MHRPFTVPRLANADAAITTPLEELRGEYEHVSQDANLSPIGARAQFSKRAAAAYKRLDAIGRPLRSKRESLLAKLDTLGASATEGRRPTQYEEQSFLQLASEARHDPRVRARLFERLTDEARVDGATQTMRRFFLALPDELTDLAHARTLIEMRLKPEIPREANELAAAVRAIDRQLEHVSTALTAIAESADRDVLESEGALGPRITTWTPEQRAEYASKHGLSALAEAVAREQVFAGRPGDAEPSEETQDPAAAEQAVKELAGFFAGHTAAAEKSAETALKGLDLHIPQ